MIPKMKIKNQSSASTIASSSAYICDISSMYLSTSSVSKSEWICDSGASLHMTGEKLLFSKLESLSEPMFVRIANNKLIPAEGKGVIEIQAFVQGEWYDRTINNVLYIPELSHSLFSVGAMTDKNFTYHSHKNRCQFLELNGNISCVGVRRNNLWVMKFRVKPIVECNLASKSSIKLWHDRLGHINFTTIKKTANLVDNMRVDNKEEFFCETCQYGKQSRKTHKSLTRSISDKPGEMIHTDVCGPVKISSPSGSKYFVLFKDDCSSYCSVYFLKHKSGVLNKFKYFKILIENQTGNKIKILRSDQGKGEYINNDFQDFIRKNGILHECSAPYTPQQNGRSERQLRTIVESARTMLINKNVSQELWTEAVNTAVYVLNRTALSQVQNMTPYEKWFGRKPDLKHIRVFGSTAYMLIPSQFRKKFDSKSRKLLFVRYDEYSSNYRLWDCEERRIEVSCNVNFNEDETIKNKKEIFTLKFELLGDNEERDNDDMYDIQERDNEESLDMSQGSRSQATDHDDEHF
ncbi:unnamed protein product [Diabrotica balteata]|uniref:Integrase catalytic domain-containing protein n=1 Tax=Diabrotica balteata TaxID=107213 RepID=A0A9N9TB93_DIABA|nr:unnamed protein product [Diabrotica balteata]